MKPTEEQLAEKLAELEPAWMTRPNLFQALIDRKDGPGLRSKLSDGAPGVRADAAQALGILKDKASTGALKALLSDPEYAVRQSAASALIALGNEVLFAEMVKALLDPEARVVAGAAMALGDSGYAKAVPYLLKAFRTDHPRIAGAIATALGKLGASDAVPWLAAAIKTGLAPVESAEALGRIGDPAGARPLIDALAHSFAPLRASAARALGFMAAKNSWDFVARDAAQTELNKVLTDADPRVRLCGAIALGQFGDTKGLGEVKKFVES